MTAGRVERRPKMTRAELLAELDRALAEAARLERAMAHLVERNRSLAILLERAEADRDTALQRLASSSYETTAWRQKLSEARAMIQQLTADRETAESATTGG